MGLQRTLRRPPVRCARWRRLRRPPSQSRSWRRRQETLMFRWDRVCGVRAAVMGIVNVTPDSFSDGGRFLEPADALAHGLHLVEAGAHAPHARREATPPRAAPPPAPREPRPGGPPTAAPVGAPHPPAPRATPHAL